jgi:tetratricopeptide (TPR) repeat protein
MGQAELGLGHADAAIAQFRQALDWGFTGYQVYAYLAASNAQAGRMDEAKEALMEAQRRNPKLTVKWLIEHGAGVPATLDGVRKAGLPEE